MNLEDDFKTEKIHDFKLVPMGKKAPDNHPLFSYAFAMCVLGVKKSGKSSFVQNLLLSLYHKIFAKVFVISPACHQFANILRDKSGCWKEITPDRMNEIIQTAKKLEKIGESIIMIIDDSMGQSILKDSTFLNTLSTHRNMNLSIVIISQAIEQIPIRFRELFDVYILFRINKADIRLVIDQLQASKFSQEQLKKLLTSSEIFGIGSHNFLSYNKAKEQLLLNLNEEITAL